MWPLPRRIKGRPKLIEYFYKKQGTSVCSCFLPKYSKASSDAARRPKGGDTCQPPMAMPNDDGPKGA